MDEIRLDEVSLFHISMRLQSPFETSFGVEQDREALLIRVRAEGMEGWGECVADRVPGYSYETVGTAWEVLRAFFIPAVLRKPISNVEVYRARLSRFKGHPLARAGLEMALWDLFGKAANRSLREMLGGNRERVPVGVSIGVQPSPADMRARVGFYLDQGYRRVKIKIKPGADDDVVAAVREAYPDLRLQVDANSAYRLDDVESILALDPYGLLMIEQPLAEDDLVDHSRLQQKLNTPLCLDESIRSLRHARQALEIGACRIINIKAGRVGGLSEGRAIHDYCLERNVPVWCGGMLETGVGRASNLALASLPGFSLPGDISASDRYYAHAIVEPRFELNADSTIDVPHGPGLGIRVLPRALREVTLREEHLRAA